MRVDAEPKTDARVDVWLSELRESVAVSSTEAAAGQERVA